MQKNQLAHFLTPSTKINSKWIKDLNVRSETIKHPEENIGCMLFDIALSNIFFGSVSSGKGSKSKNKQMGLHQTCTVKEIINKKERQPTEWEKIFANDMSDKGLISKMYKELIQLNIKKPNPI